MRWISFISATIVLLGAASSEWRPAFAGTPISGIEATTVIENATKNYPGGSSVTRFRSRGVLMADTPSLPQHGMLAECAGHYVTDKAGSVGMGSCAYVDPAGDVLWVQWQSSAKANTWVYVGGSGKFEGIVGRGDFHTVVTGNDVLVSRFTGEFELTSR